MKKYPILTITIICALFTTTTFAQSYLQVLPQSGDGVLKMLKRYELETYSCNSDKFYALNKMKKKDYILAGKKYKMPIQTYKYNGRSIRSTIGIDDWQTAKQIEHYNDMMVELGVKSTGDFRHGSKDLWVPHHLLNCSVDPDNLVPQNRVFEIFGADYKNIKLVDTKLAGAVYYVVAGHGGPDPGAMSSYEGKAICEDEYAYDISLRLARNLIEHGAVVYLITRDDNDGIREATYLACDQDEVCWGDLTIPLNQKERLTQRSDAINELYDMNREKGVMYQRGIEIHVDSRSESERIDLFFYHKENSWLSQKFTETLHQTVSDKYAVHRRNGNYEGTVTSRDLHMLREVRPVMTFIEVANIQNPYDQKRIILPSNRQAIADWLTEGAIKAF